MEHSYRWNEEFQEEDMWGVVEERESSYNKHMKRANRHGSEKNLQESRMTQQSSAPVNIPDWSKIYGTNPKKWCGWLSDDDGSEAGMARRSRDNGSGDDDGDEDNVIPPHQLMARKQLGSFSVLEGAGRTLKGRDLSRVRNAVLTKTGFLESKSHY